jgi:preprotein translocase subunit SecA
MSDTALKPGHLLGPYPQQAGVDDDSWLAGVEKGAAEMAEPLLRPLRNRHNNAQAFLRAVTTEGKKLRKFTPVELEKYTLHLRVQFSKAGLTAELNARAFALIREQAERTLGMRPYDCQIIGGWAILEGMLAEMDTGEGKTLTATLPAGVAALAGIPVHVITVNDYLAARDLEQMQPLYDKLGVSSAVVTADMSDPAERQIGYSADITYCTNKQVVFDYLRDRVAVGTRRAPIYRCLDKLPGRKNEASQLLLRGLCFAIVDEADSVMIDEARTPLKLSSPAGDPLDEAIYKQAVKIARQLERDLHFNLNKTNNAITLLDSGKRRIAAWVEESSCHSYFSSARRCNAMVVQALIALNVFHLDSDYLIRDGEVQIIDEHTGRAMPDRSWEMGLHQLIEAKEGVEISPPSLTLARITYQRFFRRYLRVGAISGTAKEVSGELWSVYRLPVFRVQPNKPSQRVSLPTRLYETEDAKLNSIVKRIRKVSSQKRPILIGTRSLAASEQLSERLAAANIKHQVLNARNVEEEAIIVADAGQAGRVTVATNMAGRGTDIKLGAGVAKAGGLHVIVAECNDAGRIDRQLTGRCGRQGDPGSYEKVISRGDPAFTNCGPGPFLSLTNIISLFMKTIGLGADVLMLRVLQRRTERSQASMRKVLLKQDQRMDEIYAFSGPLE